MKTAYRIPFKVTKEARHEILPPKNPVPLFSLGTVARSTRELSPLFLGKNLDAFNARKGLLNFIVAESLKDSL